MKHKHADLIHAWADGAEIQRQEIDGEWIDIPYNQPAWHPATEYRIKPEEKKPVVRWLWVDNEKYISNWMYSEEEAVKYCEDHIKLEWSRTEFPE